MTFPDNMTRLYAGEEALRTESLRRIGEIPNLASHLHMIEQAMNLFQALLPEKDNPDDDQLTLGNLGIRCFNALASCAKLSLSGYYQAAAIHIRDVLEVAFLLDYFTSDAALVTQWRTLSDRDRKRQFSPLVIRQALDDRDQFTGQKRRAAYEQLCKLAGHATPEGAVMLAPNPNEKTVHCGPFLEITALQAVLSEAALTSVQAAGSFRLLMKADGLEAHGVRLNFMHAEAEWLKQFFGHEPNHAYLSELCDLYSKAQQE
ncbi:hypothetical protein IT881_08695 [Erythrobacter sp. A30-3]|nr:hypothetical protein IT881_08695 [Erythrobacter sp. A30-3]